jgi:hypothetical protein
MALISQSDVEAHCSYTNTDFKMAGSAMTSNQWASYLATVMASAESIVNQYCNRSSFEVVSYTEYHSGRGRTGENGRAYRELDRVIIPFQQPVVTLTSVHEDISDVTSAESWTERVARSELVPGDFQVIVKENLTRIRFHDNVPRLGSGNVKIVYTAGYATDHPAYAAAKLAALELCANIMARKKRDQQAQVASREPTKNAADMFQIQRPDVFTQEIQDLLQPYRRLNFGRNI